MGQEVAKQVQPKANILDSSNSTAYALSPKHLYKRMSPLNRFSESEVQSMVRVYSNLAALSPRDKYIDRKTFMHYFPLDGVLAERLFSAFDKDKNGHIDCDEFLGGLALCLRGSTEERGQIIFDMFNLDGSDGVSISEISVMLKSVLSAAARIIHVREAGHSQDNAEYMKLSEVDSAVESFAKDASNQCEDTADFPGTFAVNCAVISSIQKSFVNGMSRNALLGESVA